MSKTEAFNLQKERCKLAHMNVRSELHGEESSAAIDLKFEFDSANNLLAKLHPDLRATYYRQDDNRDLVGGDHLPALRFPLLEPTIGWKLDVPRTLLRLHVDGGDVVLGGGKTNNFKLTMKEGGTVHWQFRVQFSKPDPAAIAALSALLQQVVPVTLECRDQDEEDGGGDLFDPVEQQTQQPMSEARRLAEQEFGKTGATVDTLPATGAVFPNDGVQPGDPGHSYAGQPDDMVDAEYVSPVVQAATNVATAEEAVASVVASIDKVTKGRRGGNRKRSNGEGPE
jgi:hypothetical protein